MSPPRRARIADQIQRELAELVRTELRDPRVGPLVTLTGVEMSRDQSHAKVFFTVMGAQANVQEMLVNMIDFGMTVQEAGEGLSAAAGYLRSLLAHRLTTRTVPELHFEHDESVERGVRLSRLIDEANRPEAPARPPGRGRQSR